jgi:hypothetical protein
MVEHGRIHRQQDDIISLLLNIGEGERQTDEHRRIHKQTAR